MDANEGIAVNIGAAAEMSGLSAKAIRYYELAGLIAPAARGEAGYRVYGEDDVRVLRFVHRARALGFSLDRTRRLLDLWRESGRASADVKQLALEHVAEIDAKIAALTAMRDAVQALADACDGNRRPDCPILRDLEGAASAASKRRQ
ncbi:MAG TPA: Cu(I)-responsive transcriptional regulator [Stellaceae bacterium]|nr:Cu(I)-responsive transcriptional regulator [Stellaceae bacterium]